MHRSIQHLFEPAVLNILRSHRSYLDPPRGEETSVSAAWALYHAAEPPSPISSENMYRGAWITVASRIYIVSQSAASRFLDILSRKLYTLRDKKGKRMASRGQTAAVLERIEKIPEGQPFVPSDFSDIADTHTIRRILQRATDSGTIDRAVRGVYVRPKWSNLLNAKVPPSADSIAHAVARSRGWTIAADGNAALNLLGLSTQVPAVWSYVSDGPYAELPYGKIEIRFKHAANKNITGMSPTTSLVVQALKALGKDGINERALTKITERLTAQDYQTLLSETERVTSWIRSAVLKMAAIGGWS